MNKDVGEGLVNIEQIRDGLVDGTIGFDFAGHRSQPENWQRESLIKRLTSLIQHLYDDKSERPSVFDYGMRKLAAGENIGLFGMTAYCFECGRDLPYVLKDSKTITFGLTYSQKRLDETDNTCPMKDMGDSFSYEITVESGKLVVANYFDDRKLDANGKEIEIFEPEERFSEEFSLNSTLGRLNMTKHYAENHNIAYAQMGNMSIAVFLNKNHDGVIIGNTERKNINKHTYVDEISLSVWRWMATDLAVLEKNSIELSEDAIVLDVANGVYKVTNYYEYSRKRRPVIYSTLIKVRD